MCGLAGLISFNGPIDKELDLNKFSSSLRHRGNDCTKNLRFKLNLQNSPNGGEIYLSHHRLSIIDCESRSNQPFTIPKTKQRLLFNGEIYNYRDLKNKMFTKEKFKTKGDTELLAYVFKKFGPKAVSFLDGMFSYVVFDPKKEMLFLARDQFGIKPLFYFQNKKYFAFASESFALAQLFRLNINYEGLSLYFKYGFVPGASSIFQGIQKFPPGSVGEISFSNQKLRIFKFRKSKKIKNRLLLPLYNKAISRALISDVKLGCMLSGGIDSALVAFFASKKIKNLEAFTIRYKNFNHWDFYNSKKISRQLNIKQHIININNKNGLKFMADALEKCSEPVSDSALGSVFAIAKKARVMNFKVLLNGTGGDELFGGYQKYITRPIDKVFEILRKIKVISKKRCQRRIALFCLKSLGGKPKFVKYLRKPNHQLGVQKNDFDKIANHSILKQKMISDQSYYLPDQLNFLYDQATMANTVEGRVPIQSPSIYSWFLGANEKLLVDKNKKKVLAVQIFKKCFPKIKCDRKIGFGAPYEKWMRVNWVKVIKNISDLEHLLNRFIEIKKIPFKKDKLGSSSYSQQLFRLWCFCVWIKNVKWIH